MAQYPDSAPLNPQQQHWAESSRRPAQGSFEHRMGVGSEGALHTAKTRLWPRLMPSESHMSNEEGARCFVFFLILQRTLHYKIKIHNTTPDGSCAAHPPGSGQKADLQPVSQRGVWPLDHLNSFWPQALSLTSQGFPALRLDYFHPSSAILPQTLPKGSL